MAKREQIYRLMLIAELLKRKPKGITYEETRVFLEEKFQDRGWISDLKFGEKTFERDRKLIMELLGLESAYERSSMKFKIVDDEIDIEPDSILDDVMLINAYRQTKESSHIMLFEKRKARGLKHLHGLLHSIQNMKLVSLQYQKFWDTESQKRVLEPYAIKEFNYRWYLLACDKNDREKTMKTFALDRMSELEIHNSAFTRKTYDVEAAFTHSFGIISTLDEKPQEIILDFHWHQGKYVKSLPLHTSQEIIYEDENRVVVKLKLVPTFDFIQQILSHGELVEVVSPQSLRDEVKSLIQEMHAISHKE